MHDFFLPLFINLLSHGIHVYWSSCVCLIGGSMAHSVSWHVRCSRNKCESVTDEHLFKDSNMIKSTFLAKF
jgi:hypothetical protein